VNVPLHPYTADASFLHAIRRIVPPLAEAFRPDVIVLQAGCDAHALDPLTDLRCTTSFYADAVRLVCDVADTHCAGRVIATGGGGYAVYTVVPRAWTLVWATLCDVDAPDTVPAAWLDMVRGETDEDLPRTLRDPAAAFPTSPNEEEADATNRQTVDTVRRKSLPLVTGWGLHF
jgi:acetoin utilization protein AcuC